jgi:hypothetical protein
VAFVAFVFPSDSPRHFDFWCVAHIRNQKSEIKNQKSEILDLRRFALGALIAYHARESRGLEPLDRPGSMA